MAYRVVFEPRAKRQLDALAPEMRTRVIKAHGMTIAESVKD